MDTQSRAAIFSKASEIIANTKTGMANKLIGKTEIVDAILTAVMSNGHILLEGVPGLAKTLAVRSFASIAGLSYKRVQFTPDLLPGDITGTIFYDAASGRFIPRPGPIFANIVLADEINRAPAKVQSALLEAMEEKQVTMGERSLPLPEPFIVLATMNPIEQEGTFSLPEAELDRFMLKVVVDYPTEKDEQEIVTRYANLEPIKKNNEHIDLLSEELSEELPEAKSNKQYLSPSDIRILQIAASLVHFEKAAANYAIAIVRATRPFNDSAKLSTAQRELYRYIEFGASPRASIALYRAARSAAIIAGRDYVLPEDIKNSAMSVLRHRIVPSYEADADRITAEHIVKNILNMVALP